MSGFKADGQMLIAFQWVTHSRLEFVQIQIIFLIKTENRTTYIQFILLDINRKSTFFCSIQHTKDQNRKDQVIVLTFA